MQVFLLNNTRTACVNTMVSALSYARSQAVSRNRQVTLCEADTSPAATDVVVETCTNDPAVPGTGIFENRLLVFHRHDRHHRRGR